MFSRGLPQAAIDLWRTVGAQEEQTEDREDGDGGEARELQRDGQARIRGDREQHRCAEYAIDGNPPALLAKRDHRLEKDTVRNET